MGWAPFDTGLYISPSPFSCLPSCSAIVSCHSCCNDLTLSGPFGPTVYSFPNGLTQPWAFLPMGSCVPFVFPWASLAHLLALGFLGPFTNFVFPWAFTDFIGLPQPNYFILILGVYGSVINPLLSLLAVLWVCCGPFLLFSHHTLPMGSLLTISLFLGSFEPICFLKAHLLISWTYDPLFLPLGLNGFCSLSFANFFVLLGWASFLTFRFHKKKKNP